MFTKVDTIRDLANAMFGQTEAAYDRILVDHLARKGIVLEAAGERKNLSWDDAVRVTAVVDAYALAEDAGFADAGELAMLKRSMAQRTSAWSGSALELWVTVCMERLWDKWQSEGAIGLGNSYPSLPMLDELAFAFGEKLARLGWPQRDEPS